MKPITIYTGSTGQENRVTPERSSFDGDSGFSALQDSQNVWIDPSGMVQALRGYTQEDGGAWHSLTKGIERGREVGYAIKDRTDLGFAIIVRIDTDGEQVILTPIGEGLDMGQPVSWAWAGDVGGWKVFFTNGRQYGWIDGSKVYSGWPVTETNPDPETTDDYRQLNQFFRSVTPHLLGWSGFRMFFGYLDCNGHCLGVTMHGSYGLWRRNDWLQWPDRVIMYAPARDGHYIGTTTRIYFVPSVSISSESLSQYVVADYPPCEGGLSAMPVNPVDLGFETNAPSYLTTTAIGVAILLPSGMLTQLNDRSLKQEPLANACVGVFQESLIMQSYED